MKGFGENGGSAGGFARDKGAVSAEAFSPEEKKRFTEARLNGASSARLTGGKDPAVT
ncbi:MAG: hypothetical protein JXB45_03660 [Candidatus Krumholzibacteriota bacterium]|nr:hypothetical protein [Candidatus Krumholzibacteriota bacterium]